MLQTTGFLIICLLLFPLVSCRKKNEIYILTGKLVTDCSGTPYANKELKLYQQISGGGIFPVKGGTLTYTTTDANGYFRFEYFPENGEPLWINSSVKGIPVGNLDIGQININPTADLRINLVVGNEANYSSEDTLFYQNFSYPGNPFPLNSYRYKVGPFTSEVIDSANNLIVIGARTYGHENSDDLKIEYFLNTYDSENIKTGAAQVQYCSENAAEIIFTLE